MNKKDQKIRTYLQDEKEQLNIKIDQLGLDTQSGDARREGSPFGKREEEATENMEFEKRLALEKQLKEQLGEVEHALLKIENGTYGVCDVCGKPIGEKRIEALPAASLCIDCKAKNAKK